VAVDPVTGMVRWRWNLPEGTRPAWAIAADMHSVVVASGGTIHVLDPASGHVTKMFETGCKMVKRMQLSRLNERLIVFLTADQGRAWATRIWDLDTGQEILKDRRFGLTYGQQDKMLYGLAVLRRDADIRFAFASKYSKIMVANIANETDDGPPFSEWSFPDRAGSYVHTLAVGQCGERALLAAGTDHGAILVWDFDEGTLEAYQPNAHLDQTDEVCFGIIDGEPVLIGGGSDGMLSFWTPTLEPIYRIGIGEAIYALAWVPPDGLAVGSSSGILMLHFT